MLVCAGRTNTVYSCQPGLGFYDDELVDYLVALLDEWFYRANCIAHAYPESLTTYYYSLVINVTHEPREGCTGDSALEGTSWIRSLSYIKAVVQRVLVTG